MKIYSKPLVLVTLLCGLFACEQAATEQKEAIQGLLDSMPVERDRELLRRYYIYDEDKPEICRALGLDSLHFNRVLHLAKVRFRKIMEESGVHSDLRRNSEK